MATAFYEPLGADGSTEHTVGPWGPDSQHAGPPSALLTRALEQMPGSWPGTVTRISVDILGAVPRRSPRPGPARHILSRLGRGPPQVVLARKVI